MAQKFDYRVGVDHRPTNPQLSPAPRDSVPSPSGWPAAPSNVEQLPEAVLEIADPPPTLCSGPSDQCVFIQYFKFKPRRSLFSTFRIQAGAGHSQFPPDDETDDSSGDVQMDTGEGEIESVPDHYVRTEPDFVFSSLRSDFLVPQRRCRIDDLLDYILKVRNQVSSPGSVRRFMLEQHSSADIAIASDDDLVSLTIVRVYFDRLCDEADPRHFRRMDRWI